MNNNKLLKYNNNFFKIIKFCKLNVLINIHIYNCLKFYLIIHSKRNNEKNKRKNKHNSYALN